MTIKNLLQNSGISFTRYDLSVLGQIIKVEAKKAGARYTKVDEVVQVNDYPEIFEKTMQEIAIDYFQKKATKNG